MGLVLCLRVCEYRASGVCGERCVRLCGGAS